MTQSIPRSPDLLFSFLNESCTTIRELQVALNVNRDEESNAPRVEVCGWMNQLKKDLKAALALSETLPNTGTGWPDELEALATYHGERSGFPVDLVSTALEKAYGSCSVAAALLSDATPACERALTDDTMALLVWSVDGNVQTIQNILSYEGHPVR